MRSACATGVAVSAEPATTRVGAPIRGRSAVRSIAATASQQPAYPSTGVSSSIRRAHPTCFGHRSRKSPVNHRLSTASATASVVPAARTTAARSVYAAASSRADVQISASRRTRSGA